VNNPQPKVEYKGIFPYNGMLVITLLAVVAMFSLLAWEKLTADENENNSEIPKIQVNDQVYTLDQLTPEIIQNSIVSETTTQYNNDYKESSLNISFDPNDETIKDKIIKLYKQAFPNRLVVGFRLQRLTVIWGTNSDTMEFFIAYQFKF
jgi:hypothetical protein